MTPGLFSTPITWGDYFALEVFAPLVAFILILASYPLLVLLSPRECRQCGRKLQRRRPKPQGYEPRWFCPFHDDGSPYP